MYKLAKGKICFLCNTCLCIYITFDHMKSIVCLQNCTQGQGSCAKRSTHPVRSQKSVWLHSFVRKVNTLGFEHDEFDRHLKLYKSLSPPPHYDQPHPSLQGKYFPRVPTFKRRRPTTYSLGRRNCRLQITSGKDVKKWSSLIKKQKKRRCRERRSQKIVWL